MTRLFSTTFFAIAALAVGVVHGQSSRMTQRLDSALTRLHDQAMFNGVALYAEKGKVLYQKNFGFADAQQKTRLTVSSSFNLASVSKQFITMMILILRDQNKLQFDDPVKKYLPGFPYDGITIRHLMTHTSGLPEYFDHLRHMGPLDTLTNETVIRYLIDGKPPLVFPTGDKWVYCNTGYVLLATLIENVSGKPLHVFFRERITAPLGLRNTRAYNLTLKDPIPNRVYGFRRENGRNVSNDLVLFDGIWGDGNIYASAEDLLKWDQALYTEKLVKQKTLKEAFTPVTLNDGTTYPYGFGWGIALDGKAVQHTGSWVGFRTFIHRNIERNQTLILLSNGTNELGRSVAADILNGKKPVLPKTQLIQSVTLVDGTGTPARPASVRLVDDRIWEVGTLTPFKSEIVIDGGNHVLAPGFIDSHSHHDGGMSNQPDMIAATNQGITTIVVGQDGGGKFIDTLVSQLKKKPIAVNLATYTGHAVLRMQAMRNGGLLRTCTPAELEQMKAMLKQEMDKGSFGLATGLEYESAFFSNRHEVIELAKVAAASNGRYISHIRSEDLRMEEAIDEIIQIGSEAKLPVQISHIKVAMKSKWGSSQTILAQLQRARASGINITADCYPYDYWMSTLRVLFPKRDYANHESAQLAVNEFFDPENSYLVAFAPHPEYAGKTVGAVAKMSGEQTAVTLMRLIQEAEAYKTKTDEWVEGIMGKSMQEEDIINFLRWPHTNICSDGAVDGHPRGHGAFTRVLGKYVREMKVMDLENAIYKMTALPAEHLGLSNRGIIASGFKADLVLFDPATVRDMATIENPTALSKGIQRVWVNGQVVYTPGKSTGAYPGEFLKRK
ncbi:MAG: serine hydrolase [Cytophagales bacterium]|nr:serine hydrolase [Cytophagales bacterium]